MTVLEEPWVSFPQALIPLMVSSLLRVRGTLWQGTKRHISECALPPPSSPPSALFLSTELAPQSFLRSDSWSRCYRFNRRVADLARLTAPHRKERDLPL